jgi:hypothetical protein
MSIPIPREKDFEKVVDRILPLIRSSIQAANLRLELRPDNVQDDLRPYFINALAQYGGIVVRMTKYLARISSTESARQAGSRGAMAGIDGRDGEEIFELRRTAFAVIRDELMICASTANIWRAGPATYYSSVSCR